MKQRRSVVVAVMMTVVAALIAATITGCHSKKVEAPPVEKVELPEVIMATRIVDVVAPSGPVPIVLKDPRGALELSNARVVHYSSCERNCYWTFMAVARNTSTNQEVVEAQLHLEVKLRDPKNPDDKGTWVDRFRLIPYRAVARPKEPRLLPGVSYDFPFEFGLACAGKVVDDYRCYVVNEILRPAKKEAR